MKRILPLVALVALSLPVAAQETSTPPFDIPETSEQKAEEQPVEAPEDNLRVMDYADELSMAILEAGHDPKQDPIRKHYVEILGAAHNISTSRNGLLSRLERSSRIEGYNQDATPEQLAAINDVIFRLYDERLPIAGPKGIEDKMGYARNMAIGGSFWLNVYDGIRTAEEIASDMGIEIPEEDIDNVTMLYREGVIQNGTENVSRCLEQAEKLEDMGYDIAAAALYDVAAEYAKELSVVLDIKKDILMGENTEGDE